MVANLKAGNIDGYCSGDPWNSHAVNSGTGFVMTRSLDILPGHIEKVLGVTEDWAQKYPQTHLALVKALLEACDYCDDRRNREEVLGLISQEQYIGADPKDIRPGSSTRTTPVRRQNPKCSTISTSFTLTKPMLQIAYKWCG